MDFQTRKFSQTFEIKITILRSAFFFSKFLLLFFFWLLRVQAIAHFEQWYFDSRPRISPDFVTLLFIGDDTHCGLIGTCGTWRNTSKVARRAALHLLTRLLDIERNKGMCKMNCL